MPTGAEALMRTLGATEKAIVFTDSRQDAAETAAEIEQGHFLDTLRQVVVSLLRENASVDRVALIEALARPCRSRHLLFQSKRQKPGRAGRG